MNIKIFTTLLIFFIFNNIIVGFGFRFGKNIYTIPVSGIFTCRYKSRGHVVILVTEKPNRLFQWHPIARLEVNYQSRFYLKANAKRRHKPKLFLKVYHTCIPGGIVRRKELNIYIPKFYITKRSTQLNWFNLGRIELSGIIKK